MSKELMEIYTIISRYGLSDWLRLKKEKEEWGLDSGKSHIYICYYESLIEESNKKYPDLCKYIFPHFDNIIDRKFKNFNYHTEKDHRGYYIWHGLGFCISLSFLEIITEREDKPFFSWLHGKKLQFHTQSGI
jgi:hypothetical protein